MEDILLRIVLIGVAFVIMRAGWTQWNLRRMLAERIRQEQEGER